MNGYLFLSLLVFAAALIGAASFIGNVDPEARGSEARRTEDELACEPDATIVDFEEPTVEFNAQTQQWEYVIEFLYYLRCYEVLGATQNCCFLIQTETKQPGQNPVPEAVGQEFLCGEANLLPFSITKRFPAREGPYWATIGIYAADCNRPNVRVRGLDYKNTDWEGDPEEPEEPEGPECRPGE